MESRNRRSSILKVRQHIDITDETIAGNGNSGPSTTTNRRVSFHNVKHVKQYDRDHGKLIDASPLREKITDTMDSDGILTPRGRNLDATETADNQTIRIFGSSENGNQTADMSLETVNENEGSETMKLFDITREQTIVFEKTVETRTTVTERVVERFVAPGSSGEDTMALFNMTDCEEKDMSVDHSAVFVVPRARRHNATINQTVPMDLDESRVGPVNDTISIFNMSSASAKDMDISNATINETVSKSPARSVMARVTEETPEDVDMEITQMDVEKTLIANQKTLVLNESMEMSMVASEASYSPARTRVNDTMSLFRSPITHNNQINMIPETKKAVFEENNGAEDMEITNVDEPATVEPPVLNEPMDISVMHLDAPKSVNDTMAPFQSPARQANQSYRQEEPSKRVFSGEEEHDVDMKISQVDEHEKTSMSMDMSVVPSDSPKVARDNVALSLLLQSPARVDQYAMAVTLDAKQPFDEQGAGEGTFLAPNDSTEQVQSPHHVVVSSDLNMESHQSEIIVGEESGALEMREQERAMANASIMDVSGVHESPDLHQKSLNVSSSSVPEHTNNSTFQKNNTSLHKVTEHSFNDPTANDEESGMSPQKTMQIETDQSTLHEATSERDVLMHQEEDIQMEVHETTSGDLVQKETTLSSHMSFSFSSASRKPAAKSHLSRRRSLLRESILESPRRIALENSMITMNVGEMTALSEHRRRKSVQLSQHNASNTSASMLLNESVNTSGGRDIFALNTSIRSPHFADSSQNGNISNADSPAVRESTSFQMPNFDPAVSNIIWLTAENGEPVPEASDFARLISDEKMKMEQEIQKKLSVHTLNEAKWEAVRTSQWSKLSHDEKEAVLIARQDSEIRFLEMRLAFAQKHRQKYEQDTQRLLQSNARIAEKLSEIESMDAMQSEIDKLKNQPTETDCSRIKAEWKAAKKERFELKLAGLAKIQHTLLLMNDQKKALKMEIEEREEELKRLRNLEETNEKMMQTMYNEIVEILKN